MGCCGSWPKDLWRMTKEWLKKTKEECKKDSVSQSKESLPCCSNPENILKKSKNIK
ncbi:hypothetical protein KKC52_06530 [bacterium]|nr:hypothetical protein [bacterium]